MTEKISQIFEVEIGLHTVRKFPDGESYVRIETDLENRDVIIVSDLSHPDCKTLPLLFAADLAASLHAKTVGLIVPYLPYMRQDKAFQAGEAITSHYYAKLLSSAFDWLLTVDPHLHRIKNLDQIYALHPIQLSATKALVAWIKQNVPCPLLVGPDSESLQWVQSVANDLAAPFLVAKKSRCGDRCIEIDLPDTQEYDAHSPVIIDDVISTGTTLIETIKALRKDGLKPPICLAVHALLNKETSAEILNAGAKSVITTNTIPHFTNGVDINFQIAHAVKAYLDKPRSKPLCRIV